MQKWIEIKTLNSIQDFIEIVPLKNIVHLSKHGGADPKILFNLKSQYQVYCNKQSTVIGHDIFSGENVELKYDDIIPWVLKKID